MTPENSPGTDYHKFNVGSNEINFRLVQYENDEGEIAMLINRKNSNSITCGEANPNNVEGSETYEKSIIVQTEIESPIGDQQIPPS